MNELTFMNKSNVFIESGPIRISLSANFASMKSQFYTREIKQWKIEIHSI